MKLKRQIRHFLLPLALLMVLLALLLPSQHTLFAQGEQDRWAGVVSDENGAPIAATVTINGVEGSASADGTFELYVPRAGDERYVINAEKFGYVPVSQVHVGTAIETLNLTLKKPQRFEIDPSQPVEVEDERGTRISIGTNSLVDANGNPATGPLQLLVYTYDLTQEEMPGDMSALDDEGQPLALESAGVFYAQFSDAEGNEYNLAPEAQAEISIPVDQSAEWPDIIPLWSYDESRGLWIEEGQATQTNGRFAGKVGHFSSWNFDVEKRNPACIKLTVDPVFLALNSPIQVKAVLMSPHRVRNLSLTQTNNVLYNLPANAKVNFYMPPSSTTPFASVNTGAPWGGVGRPPHPYDDCNGTLHVDGAQAAIQGMKFNDLNGNGVQDANEPGLEGWVITLTDADGNTSSTTTDANGNYEFTSLAAGSYTVSEVQQDGWIQTAPPAPGTHTVQLQAGQVVERIDFGNQVVTPMCICQVDLDNNSHNCQNIPAITFVNGPSNNQAVVKINLDPNSSGHTQAQFDVTYGDEPQGWTVNIGDSRSNNGYAGDGASQSRDAEMQILNSQLAVYGNDYTPPADTTDGHRHLLSVNSFASAGATLSFKVRDEHLRWDNHSGLASQLNSSNLYALNGQVDAEGPVNYDIYAGFNRTIGSAFRNGKGVSKVNIILCNKVELDISKSGPATANAGDPITYNLTVTNTGSAAATNLIIKDALPAGATYVSGGTLSGNVVSWTVPTLAPGSSTTVQFVVTANQTIVNSEYKVSADGDISATGTQEVTTVIATEECVGPPPDMTAWWPLDEPSGSTAAEIVNGNDGTHINGPTPAPGKVAGALSFDGVDDYVEVPSAPELNFGEGDLSIDAWIKTSDRSGVKVIVDKRYEDGSRNTQGYSLYLNSGQLGFQLADGDGTWFCSSDPVASSCTNYGSNTFVADGEWHLVAVTVDRDQTDGGKFYVDGNLVKTFNPTIRAGSLDNDKPLRMASRSSFQTGLLKGTIDEVELFNRALDASEILSIYNAGSAGKCKRTQGGEPDVWVEDTPYNHTGAPDTGDEPDSNMTGVPMWRSKAIWVRNNNTPGPHQNPEFGQTNYVNVALSNRGTATASNTTVEVYAANASTGLAWPANWTLIGTANVANLPASTGQLVQIPWNPAGTGHYCLIVRLVNSDDPMTNPETSSIGNNVRNNNNIAWRNTNVVDLLKSPRETVEFTVRQITPNATNLDLVFEETQNLLGEGGGVIVDLGPLFRPWRNAGGNGENITVLDGTTIRLNAAPATIAGIPMQPEQEQIVQITTEAFEPMPGEGTSREYHLDVTQVVDGEPVGGVSYAVVTRAQGTDTDGDGTVDVNDDDDDNDGILDDDDPNPLDVALGALSITKVTPRYGLNDGPATVYIYGQGFSEPLTVTLGPTQTLDVNFVMTDEDPQRIRAVVPAGVTPGTYDITVQTDSGSATLANAYEVLDSGITDDLLSSEEWLWTNPMPMRVGYADSSVGLLVQHLGGTATLDSLEVEFRLGGPDGELLGRSRTNLLAPDAIESSGPVIWEPTEPSDPDDNPKDYTVCAIIDPDNVVPETNEDNNIICRDGRGNGSAITVLPPHCELSDVGCENQDTEPPEVDRFLIDDDASSTNQQAVTLDVAGTDYPLDNASGMNAVRHLEFEYFHGARRWAPVRVADWVDYDTAQSDYDWELMPSYGMRYMQAWASDNAQNISLKPGVDVIDLLPSEQADSVGRNGVIFYRIFLEEGERFAATMTPESGDPDMFVWLPNGDLEHNVNSTGAETVEFDAPFEGTYQIEIHGPSSGSADYRLTFGASKRAQMDDPAAHSRSNKRLPEEPAVPLDEWPEYYDVGTPPVASTDEGFTIYLPISIR